MQKNKAQHPGRQGPDLVLWLHHERWCPSDVPVYALCLNNQLSQNSTYTVLEATLLRKYFRHKEEDTKQNVSSRKKQDCFFMFFFYFLVAHHWKQQ